MQADSTTAMREATKMLDDPIATALESELDQCGRESLGLDPEPTGNLGVLLKRFAALEHARREKDAELETLAEQIAALQQPILDAFADAGVQNARVDGLTVYIRHDKYVSKAKGVETETVVNTLKDLGLGYMVSEGYNASSLKAKVGEWQKDGIEVPPQLAGLLSIGEVPRVTTRK